MNTEEKKQELTEKETEKVSGGVDPLAKLIKSLTDDTAKKKSTKKK